MSRRSTPERLSEARRSATIARLISAGMLPARAAAEVAAYEVRTAQDGRPRDAAYWEEAWSEIRATNA